MAKRLTLLALLIPLAACDSAADREIERYERMERAGASDRELCAVAGDVVAALSYEDRPSELESWNLTQDFACFNAQFEG